MKLSAFMFPENGHSRTLPLVLIALLILINYGNTLRAGFVYDDHDLIVENGNIRSIRSIPRFFSDPVWTTAADPTNTAYRPLRSSLWALEYRLWGLNPAGYHAVNVVLHILNSFLVFLLLLQIASSLRPAFAGALIFASHPVMTEAVCWASSLDTLLCLFFYLIGLMCYLWAEEKAKSRRMLLYAISLVAASLSLLSKEMAVTFPITIAVIDIWRNGYRDFSLKRLAPYAPFVMVTVAFIVLRTFLLGRFAQVDARWSEAPSAIFAVMGREFAYYCRLLFFPFHLTVFPFLSRGPLSHDSTSIIGLAVAIILFLSSILTRRTAPRVSLGICLFFVFLLPVSNIIPTWAVIAERHLYFAIVGFLIVVSAQIQLLESRPSNSSRKMRLDLLGTGAMAGLIFLLSLNTIVRSWDWQNDALLFSSAAKVAPGDPRPHISLGRQYLLRGDYENTQRECFLALESDTDNPRPYVLLGNMYFQKGFLSLAEKQFAQALQFNPYDYEANNGIGLTYGKQGRLDEALVAFQTAWKNKPDSKFLSNAGAVLIEKGEFAEALKYLDTALRFNPDNREAAFNKACVLFRQNRFGEAVRFVEDYLSRNSYAPEMRALLRHYNSVGIK